MVETRDLTRTGTPVSSTPEPPKRRAPVLFAAFVTTLWAATLSYAAVLGVVTLAATTGGASARTIARFASAGWLLTHGVPVATPDGSLRLVPMLLAAWTGWRLVRAGVHTCRAIGARRSRSLRKVLVVAAAVGGVQAALGLVVAQMASGSGLSVVPELAAAVLGLVGFLAAGVGASHEAGLTGSLYASLPPAVRDGVRTGAVAALLVCAGGAAVAGVATAVRGANAADIVASYHSGLAGQAGLTALCLAYAPNLAVWASAYLLGPGFAVGSHTIVGAAQVHLGALPAVPVLVGLPTTAVGGPAALLLAVPVACAMTAGWLLVRRLAAAPESPVRRRSQRRSDSVPEGREVTWSGLVVASLVAGPVAGVLLGLAAWCSGGSLGGGRLAVVGPGTMAVALVGTVVVTSGSLIAASATRVLLGAGR